MKTNKVKLYNVLGVAGVISIPVAVTLGVVYGTKEGSDLYVRSNAVNFGEEFFDSDMSSPTSTFAAQHLLNPSGGADLSEIIRLDSNMDSESARKMILPDKNGSVKSIQKFEIKLTDYRTEAGINKAFLDTNEKMRNYFDKHSSEKLGIYIGRDFNLRKIVVSVFNLRSFSEEDLKMVNDYQMDLGDVRWDDVTPTFLAGSSDYDPSFFQVFGAELTTDKAHIGNRYFKLGKGSPLFKTLPADKTPKEFYSDKHNIIDYVNKFQDKWHTEKVGSFPMIFKMVKSEGQPTAISKTLAEHGMFATIKPVVEWNKQRVKLVFKYYKGDASSTLQDFQGLTMYNPTNVHTIVKYVSLSGLGNNEAISPENVGLSSIDEVRKVFRDAIVPHLSSSKIDGKDSYEAGIYSQYLTQRKLVQPGLDILASLMPSLKTPIDGMIKTVKYANYLDNPEKQNKFTDVFTDDFIDSLFKMLADDTTIDAPAWFQKNIIEFCNQQKTLSDDDFFWSSMSKLSDAYVNNGGQYRLYSLFSGWQVIANKISDAIETKHPEVVIAESDNLIGDLLKFLIDSNAIPDGTVLQDIFDDPFAIIKEALKNIIKNETVFPPNLLESVLPLIPINVIKSHLGTLTPAIKEFLGDGRNLAGIIRLLQGNYPNTDDLIDDLFKDNKFSIDQLLKMLPNILATPNEQIPESSRKALQNLAVALNKTGIIPSFLLPLLPDTFEASTNAVSLLNSGTVEIVFDFIKSTQKLGIDLTDAGKDSLKQIFDGFQEIYRDKLKDYSTESEKDALITAAMGVLTSGINISDQTLKEILHFVEVVLPSTDMHFDVIEPIAYKIITEGIGALDEEDFNKITPLLSGISILKDIPSDKLGSFIYKLLHGNMKIDELKSFVEMIKPGILKTDIPQVGTVEELLNAAFTGRTWLSSGFFHPINTEINSLLNKFIGHTRDLFANGLIGLKQNDIEGLLKGVKSAIDDLNGLSSIISSIKPIVNSIEKIAGPIWDDSAATANALLDLLKNPVVKVDPTKTIISDDTLNTVLNIVSKEMGISSTINVGEAIEKIISSGLSDLKLEDINSILTTINTLVPSISDSVKLIIAKVLTDAVMGEDALKAKEASFKDEVQKISESISGSGVDAEVALSRGAILPKNIGTYTDFSSRIISDKNIIKNESKTIFEKLAALADANEQKGKIISYNNAISVANKDFADLTIARSKFIADYATKKVIAMTTITSTDSKHLDSAYDAVEDELDNLYKTDVSKLSTAEIVKITARISAIEPLIGEINSDIVSVNGDVTFDVTPLTNRVTKLGITIKGLSPIDPSVFAKFKTEFDAATDTSRDSGNWEHWSSKASILGDFIDKNSKLIFGDSWSLSNFGAANSSGNYDHSFKAAADDHHLGHAMSLKGMPSDYTAKGFAYNVAQKVLTPEDFAKLQKYVLIPLGL